MLPSQVLTVALSEKSYAPTALSRSSVLSVRARALVSIGRALGNRSVADINPARTDPVVAGLLWRWSGPLRQGRLPGDIVVAEMPLSVLAYNLTRVMNIVGVKALMSAIGT
jgi:hypothetical protein